MPQLYVCPQCGRIFDDNIGECPKCHVRLEVGGPEVIARWLKMLGAGEEDEFVRKFFEESPVVREMKEKIENLRKVIEKIESVDRVNLSDIKESLNNALKMLSNGETERAYETVAKCADVVKEKSVQFKVLQDALKVAERKISEAYEMGGDVSEARKMVELSRKFMEMFDYEKAINYAIKGSLMAEREMAKCVSWHVEIQDWLK
ncbi:MAG: hypothetical protein DRN20_04210 [Thermoplasmata archaeon]|nr:MAG: hypothetical protein DRN20_04210 [Thermoplasmata archaeon]